MTFSRGPGQDHTPPGPRLCTVSGWITRTEATVCDDVAAPPGDVRAFYTDLDNITLVHPLVVSVRSIGRDETADGYVQTYRVSDRIPLGPVRLPTSYVARLHVPATGDVMSEARQFPRVRLRGTVAFDPIETGTRVTEQIRIEAPWLLASLTTHKAVEAHTEMLAGIRRHFDDGQR